MFTKHRFTPPVEPVLTGNYAADVRTLIEDRRRTMLALSEWFERLEEKDAIQLDEASIAAPNGIKFPATQVASTDANTLDDYEEGSFTPGISFGGGVTGITYSAQTASYTKIGNRVLISGYVALSAKGSSTGAAKLTGLPFTVRNNNDSNAVLSAYLVAVTFANQHQHFFDLNATTASLNEVTEAGTATNLTDADFANNSGIFFSGVYRAA